MRQIYTDDGILVKKRRQTWYFADVFVPMPPHGYCQSKSHRYYPEAGRDHPDPRGIHRRILYGLRDDGALISATRGLYQLAEMDSFPTEIDLVNVAKLAPHGVICLISALSFHGLTTPDSA